MRVLVVEDYKPIRDSLVQGLREADFAVDFAVDGNQALVLFNSQDYDVVILDLMLPGLDGLSVLKTIGSNNNKARVLILSAKDQY